MKFLQSFLNFFGLGKEAQVKPSDFPSYLQKHTPGPHDRNRSREYKLDPRFPEPTDKPGTDHMTDAPEQMSSNKDIKTDWGFQKEGDDDPRDEGASMPYPYIMQEDTLTHKTMPTNTRWINEQMSAEPGRLTDKMINGPYEDDEGLARSAMLTLDDVRKINPIVGDKMEKLGIEKIDKEMFEQNFIELYTEASRLAAEKRISISEALDELL